MSCKSSERKNDSSAVFFNDCTILLRRWAYGACTLVDSLTNGI